MIRKEYAVVVHVNDRTQTHVATIKADLKKAQAQTIAEHLNAAFASTGTGWFAVIREEED